MDSTDLPWNNPEAPDQNAEPPTPHGEFPTLDPPASRNFCPKCGTAWQKSWLVCPACQGVEVPLTAKPETACRSHVALALALYFTLLVATGTVLIIGVTRAKEALDIVRLEIAHALIITLAALAMYRTVIGSLFRRVKIVFFLAAIGAALAMFVSASGILFLEHHLLGVREVHIVKPFLSSGFGWTAVILATCVQPAIFEEIGFRGVILPALQPTLSPRDAVIVSALLFMTLHLTAAAFPYLFLLGLVLGYLRLRSGSLLPGMLLHFTYNLLCIVTVHR